MLPAYLLDRQKDPSNQLKHHSSTLGVELKVDDASGPDRPGLIGWVDATGAIFESKGHGKAPYELAGSPNLQVYLNCEPPLGLPPNAWKASSCEEPGP